MYYINVDLEPDVTQQEALEIFNSIKSMPEVANATMESDGNDDEC